MTDLRDRKPILCLDFDGVCHQYTSGWKGADVCPDPPVLGLYEFLREAVEHFEVNIFSSRSGMDGGIQAMVAWLYANRPNVFDIEILHLSSEMNAKRSVVKLSDGSNT